VNGKNGDRLLFRRREPRILRLLLRRKRLSVPIFLLASSCGYVGDPKPPALNIPAPVTDLQAMEYGPNIVVKFSMPQLTTEGLPLAHPNEIQIYSGPATDPFLADQWAESAKKATLVPTDATTYQQEIPVAGLAGKDVAVAVRVLGPKGKPSAWSNVQRLPLVAPVEQPSGVKADNVERGVALHWNGSGPHYRIYRAEGDAKLERFAESDQPEYLDDTTEYAKHYRYLIQAVVDDKRQSLASDPVAIVPVDTFPPAVPGALTALAGVSTIELAWTRNAEPDFKGYNIFRAEGDGAFEKIGSLVEAPAYSDAKVQKGKRYRYTVTAVDILGNESGRSGVADAIVP